MKIERVFYKPFSIRLKSPLINSAGFIDSRSGFIVFLRDELGNTTIGEVAPLPGFSLESIEDAEKELVTMAEIISGFGEIKDIQSLRNLIRSVRFSPSVRFGLGQAIIGNLLRRDPSLIKKHLPLPSTSISINTVIGIEKDVLGTIQNKLDVGFSVFKIKIGRNDFNDDLSLIKEIRARFGNEIKIRLDANGKWNLEKSKQYLEKLFPFNIEFIEEPCHGIENLVTLSGTSEIPVAIDESLLDINDAYSIIEQSSISFLVIKPMIKGVFFETTELIERAAQLKKNIIISSSFETPLGKSALVLLASIVHHPFAHGLDSTDFFEDILFDDPYKVEKGKIYFNASEFPPLFNIGKL